MNEGNAEGQGGEEHHVSSVQSSETPLELLTSTASDAVPDTSPPEPARTPSELLVEFLSGLEKDIPIKELERVAILVSLRRTKGSVGRSARALKIGRATLYRRINGENFLVPEAASSV
jgi:transcriptional regulator of acetoin/glycerol metabolism